MVNISTGENTLLEHETFGDARPVINGKKIAWINRTQNDVHVLDLALNSYPNNVTVDFGADDCPEFNWNKTLGGSAYINETALAEALNNFVNKVSGGKVEIPIKIPVVIGQLMVAPCPLATTWRI